MNLQSSIFHLPSSISRRQLRGVIFDLQLVPGFSSGLCFSIPRRFFTVLILAAVILHSAVHSSSAFRVLSSSSRFPRWMIASQTSDSFNSLRTTLSLWTKSPVAFDAASLGIIGRRRRAAAQQLGSDVTSGFRVWQLIANPDQRNGKPDQPFLNIVPFSHRFLLCSRFY